MLLRLIEAIKKSGGTDLEYFQSAYFWKFQKHINVFGDILAFRTQQHIPDYVVQFMRHTYGE